MFKANDYEQSTGTYLKEIGGFKPLTKQDEMKLWRRLKKNPYDAEAKNRLITSNLKFVVSVAKSYRGRGLSMSDLVAEGNMGLLRAYRKFDPKKGVKFISYSVHWIRQSILEALQKRNNIGGDELPADYENQENGVDDDYIEANNTPGVISEMVETWSDSESERSTRQHEAIERLFVSLTPREIQIIKRYFGVGGVSGETLEEIGLSMSLTKERVRQIKEDAMKKMRSAAMENPEVIRIYSEYVLSKN